jgi:hypothetical protein
MNFFLENPWRIVIIGSALEAVLTFLLLQTGRGKIFWAMIAVGVLTLGLLTVERLVVTDREAVAVTLDAAVASIKAADEGCLLRCIAASAKSVQEDARWELQNIEVEELHIIGLEVAVDRSVSPPAAEAKFMAVGIASLKNSVVQHESFARHVAVRLRWIGDRWLVEDYTIEGIHGPLRKASLR